jgi:lipoprotein-anchoring transpeptidase ErfK/SrfK
MGRLAVVLIILVAFVSCGGQTAANREVTAPVGNSPTPQSRQAPPASPPTQAPVPDVTDASVELWTGFSVSHQEHVVLAAMTRGEVSVFEQPGDIESFRTLPATTILGTATVVSAIGQPTNDGWVEVLLPGRPNGGTGWIETRLLDLYVVTDRIVIDLSDRELVYYIDDAEALRSAVAIGTSHNPTPTGTYFVTDSVRVKESGPWGPAALGLSARSETITEFNGGDGIIGIHGTNNPNSIGRAATLGCVRLPNDVITELRDLVSLGTPVEIRA